jgi:hypothetical protein
LIASLALADLPSFPAEMGIRIEEDQARKGDRNEEEKSFHPPSLQKSQNAQHAHPDLQDEQHRDETDEKECFQGRPPRQWIS